MRARSRSLIGSAAATAVLALGAVNGTSAASASVLSTVTDTLDQLGCSFPETAQALSRFGDEDQYFLAPGGDFETLSWWEDDARLTEENDPFFVVNTRHRSSVRLRDEAWVRSPGFCIDARSPHLRFMAKSPGSDQLDVRVDLFDEEYRWIDTERVRVQSDEHRSWSPSPKVSLKTVGWEPGQTAYASVRFYTEGTWLIDNVLIDPYSRR